MICLDHVHIFSSNVEKTIFFYATMFGAKVVYDTPLIGKRNVRLDIGGMAMHVYDQKPRSVGRGLVNHLGLRTDDLDSLVKHMQTNGVTFRKTITEAESLAKQLRQSDLVGLWKDRDDIGESSDYARQLREQAQRRRG